jgi:Ca-activated chloride channel family protein
MRKSLNQALKAAALGLLAACALSACTPREDSPSAPPAANEFRILAGSELKDVADKVIAYGKGQGVDVKVTYSGSLDAVDQLTEKHNYDAVWLSHGKYLQLVPAVKTQIKASEKTMFSRVVMGVKPEKMKELGWKSGKTTWREIIAAAKDGKFKFAMTSPAGSNTGFVSLLGVASELSGKGDALEEQDIPVGKLKEMFAGQSMTAGSSGILAEQFVANPKQADGIINYEASIRTIVQKGVLLEVLIPKEGVITADYPLMLLSKSKHQPFYEALVAHLRSDAVQKQIAQETFRTPLAGNGSDEVVNELPFPGSVKIVDALLGGFMDQYSKPATSFFLLDTSGSMNGDRIEEERNAMLTLASGDGSVSGRFATFRQRERISITTFTDKVQPAQEYELTSDTSKNKEVLAEFSKQISALRADGGTAVYDAVLSVYAQAQAELAKGERTVSIVLLSDGQSQDGMGLNDFLSHLEKVGGPKVPVFAILYGESNANEMAVLVERTGGRVFDARKMSLKQVMKAIRSYQ